MVTRVGGLASGMDIDSIVAKLMQAEKAPLDKLYQQKQTYEWQRDAYRDVNKQLKAFDTFLFDDMTLQKNFYTKTVKSTNPVVSATASSAAVGSLQIDKVTQLASSASKVGTITDVANRAKTTTLADLGVQADANGEIKVKIMVAKPKSEQVINPNIDDESFDYSQNFTEVEKTFKATDSIQDVVSGLNKGTGLNAFYDEATGQFSLTSTKTGEGAMTRVYDDTVGGGSYTDNDNTGAYVKQGQELFSKLGFSDGVLTTGGKDAKLSVNGAEISRDSNTFDINGYSVSLNDTYTDAKPITLTATTDVDNMVDKIKKFVETYNGVVESFTNSTKEAKYRDYKPLTDEQKKDMTEDQIKSWEEKSKSGLLRGDSLLRSSLSSMRTTLYEKGGSSNPAIDTLYEMGITTSSKISDNGKLVIDEEKLRAAIEKDADAVFSTFSNTSDETPGLVQKLRENITNTTINIEKKAGKADAVNNTFNIGRNLVNVESRIDLWKSKLENIEARYWKQFSAMESAISKANNQSSSLFAGQQQ